MSPQFVIFFGENFVIHFRPAQMVNYRSLQEVSKTAVNKYEFKKCVITSIGILKKKKKKNNYHHFLQLLVFGIKNTTSQHLNA